MNLAINSPVAGYELSIYSSIPVFWILIISAIAIGISLLVWQAIKGNDNYFWPSFAVIILGNLVILLLPYIRGYYLYGGNDPLGHFNITSSIVMDGHFSETNYYPIIHILGAQISQISSLPVEITINFLPVIFSILFMVFMYLLAKKITPKRSYALLAAAASAALLFSYYHITVYPQGLSLLLFPLFFYVYFNAETYSTSWRIILIIFLFLFPFLHANTCVVVILALVAAEIAKYVYRARGFDLSYRITFNPALISFITFMLWWSSYSVFGMGIRNVYNWFVSEAHAITRVEELDSVFSMSTGDWFSLMLKMYGDHIIYLALTLIAFIIIIWRFTKKYITSLSLFQVLFIYLGSLLAYFIAFLAGFMTMGRVLGLNVLLWAGPILASFALITILKNMKVRAVIATLILSTTFVLSIFSLYRSPWISQPNWQTTYQDVDGIEWYQDNKPREVDTFFMGTSIGSNTQKIPLHFGYDINSTLGESIAKDMIILFGKRQEYASENQDLTNSTLSGTWYIPGFNSQDYANLFLDPTVSQLYSNGEFKILLAESGK